MKILCISDEIDPLVYSNSIRERFSDIDIVLSAGDLPLSYYGFIVSSLNKPLVFVFGNHKLSKLGQYKRSSALELPQNSYRTDHSEASGAIFTGAKVVKVKGVLIAGLGGSMRYNNGPNQFTNFAMRLRTAKLLPRLLWNRIFHGRFIDILLTHAPPEGIGDQSDICHRGFRSFLSFMHRFKPKYLVHGHIHIYDCNQNRSLRYEQTRVVNAYNHTVIELDNINE